MSSEIINFLGLSNLLCGNFLETLLMLNWPDSCGSTIHTKLESGESRLRFLKSELS
jgi:hypothetical protein